MKSSEPIVITKEEAADRLQGYSLWAREVVDGSLRPVPRDQVAQRSKETQGWVWYHVRAYDVPLATSFLQDELGLSPLAVEDAMSDVERPALHELEDGSLFLSAHAVAMVEGEPDFIEVAFFLSERCLVTVIRDACPLIAAWLARWERNPNSLCRHPAATLHAIVDSIVDGYFPAMDELESRVDDLEERVLGSRGVQVGDMIRLKRHLLEMRRHIAPQRDVLNSLLRADLEMIPREYLKLFQDVYDHTLRVLESSDVNRDILAAILDAHLSIVSNNLNNVMKVLTVLSTILMTGSLVAGIYGMNFKHMPELDWVFGYPMAIGLMGLLAMAALWFFRRKRWI